MQLLNRQKRSKKKVPVPLTADMLNELNKNHMGGFDNYGQEELYIDDQWDDVKTDFKPKVCNQIRKSYKKRIENNAFFDMFSASPIRVAAAPMIALTVGAHSNGIKRILIIITIRNSLNHITHRNRTHQIIRPHKMMHT